MTKKKCADCGSDMDLSMTECPECGALQKEPLQRQPKSWHVLIFMCLFGGFLGVHRFYVGKIGSGVLMLFTLGGLGVWVMYDLVKISMSLFTDRRGNFIVNA